MTKAQNETQNIVIGAGEMYLDLFDAAGKTAGERYLGDAASATLTITTENTVVFSGTGAVGKELANVVRTIGRQFSLSLRDMSLENQALFAVGDVEDDAIAATAVADEEIPVKPNRWYQLGVAAARPAGINKVGSVAVTGGTVSAAGTFTAASTAWTEDTDYTVDEASGRIGILDTATTRAAGAAIQVDYTPAAQSGRQQVVAATKQLRGAFRYIEDAAEGRGRNFYAPRCLVTPGGDLTLLDGRSAEQQIALAVSCLEPAGALAPLYIDAQPS